VLSETMLLYRPRYETWGKWETHMKSAFLIPEDFFGAVLA